LVKMPKGTTPFDLNGFLASVGKGKTMAKYKGKQTIFSQGDCADSIFYIHKGKVKLVVLSKSGKEAVIAILTAGDFLGEGCLAGQSLRMSSAVSIADSTISRIDKREMIRVLRKQPTFSELFLAYVLTRNIRIEEDLMDQLFNSSEKRLARILLLLANVGKEKPEPVISSVGHETLGEMIGVTRERVNFFMNKFRRLGFIDYNGKLNGRLEVHPSLLSVILHD